MLPVFNVARLFWARYEVGEAFGVGELVAGLIGLLFLVLAISSFIVKSPSQAEMDRLAVKNGKVRLLKNKYFVALLLLMPVMAIVFDYLAQKRQLGVFGAGDAALGLIVLLAFVWAVVGIAWLKPRCDSAQKGG